MNTITQQSETLQTSFERQKANSDKGSDHLFLLRGMLEGMPDGFMIATSEGLILQSNSKARSLCRKIDTQNSSDTLPQAIQRLCDALLDSRETFSSEDEANAVPYLILEDDIETHSSSMIRVRVQWLDQESSNAKMLIILEDRYQSARCRAIAEAQRYGLSSRESEVWLYRCIGYTYKQIANELFIAIDTVKKHVKSINAKRDRFHCLNCEHV